MARKQLGVAASNAADAIKKAELDAAVAGGGASPGGSTTQLQFNDGGVFAGDPDLTWNKTTHTLGLGGTDPGMQVGSITTEPTTIPADTLRMYAKSIAGKMVVKTKGPTGVDSPIQNAMWGNNIILWASGASTSGSGFGTDFSTAGTFTNLFGSFATTLYATIRRTRYSNIVTTVNQALGLRTANPCLARGGSVGGGFLYMARAGFETWTNGGRMFFGLFTGTTAIIIADASASTNFCGFAVEAGDNGLIYFMSRAASGAVSKVSTGMTIVSGKGYDTYIHCAPGGSSIFWRIVDINTGAEASGVETTNLPVGTTQLNAGVYASNGALTPVNSIQLGINRMYVESDY